MALAEPLTVDQKDVEQFPPRRYRISVQVYRKMGEEGLIPPDARVELINGEIIEMSPISREHALAVTRLNKILVMALGDDGIVSPQNFLQTSDYSEPEPDIVVFRGGAGFFLGDLEFNLERSSLVIEVSKSTLRKDQTTKLALYAQAGIQEYWIVNLQENVLEVYRNPRKDSYDQKMTLKSGDTVSPLAFPAISLDLKSILG